MVDDVIVYSSVGGVVWGFLKFSVMCDAMVVGGGEDIALT